MTEKIARVLFKHSPVSRGYGLGKCSQGRVSGNFPFRSPVLRFVFCVLFCTVDSAGSGDGCLGKTLH